MTRRNRAESGGNANESFDLSETVKMCIAWGNELEKTRRELSKYIAENNDFLEKYHEIESKIEEESKKREEAFKEAMPERYLDRKKEIDQVNREYEKAKSFRDKIFEEIHLGDSLPEGLKARKLRELKEAEKQVEKAMKDLIHVNNWRQDAVDRHTGHIRNIHRLLGDYYKLTQRKKQSMTEYTINYIT